MKLKQIKNEFNKLNSLSEEEKETMFKKNLNIVEFNEICKGEELEELIALLIDDIEQIIEHEAFTIRNRLSFYNYKSQNISDFVKIANKLSEARKAIEEIYNK